MPRRGNSAGFSTLEVMIVLTIMSLAMSIVLPRGAVMLDRMTTHVVFFEFQQAVSETRLEAFRSEQAVTIAADPEAPGPGAASVALRAPWSYRLDRPLEITAGGRCSDVMAQVYRDGSPVMRLRGQGGACRFTRLD